MVATYVLMMVLIVIGFFLLVIPGIYLSIAYSMAMLLVIDKKMSPWQALETSRKAVTKKWFSFFGLYLCIGLILVVSAIPLLIGWIWTIPLAIISTGMVYRNLFGCAPATLEE